MTANLLILQKDASAAKTTIPTTTRFALASAEQLTPQTDNKMRKIIHFEGNRKKMAENHNERGYKKQAVGASVSHHTAIFTRKNFKLPSKFQVVHRNVFVVYSTVVPAGKYTWHHMVSSSLSKTQY